MVTIKNEILEAKIDPMGAELKSLKKCGVEYLWQGDPAVWKDSSPVLFPICGALKDNKYIYKGKEYSLLPHGFARLKLFEVESLTENSAVLLLKSDEETIKNYPFKFEFRAIFTLKDDSLITEYKVNNLSEETMYFSVGSHEGYAAPEGIENYDIIFPQKETLETVLPDGRLLQNHALPVIKDSEFLPLYDRYFLIDALIFLDIESKSLRLRNRLTGKEIKVDYPDCKNLLVWHKYAGGYICIEPWSGRPDGQDSNYDITNKKDITALEPKGEYSNIHTVTIVK